MAKILWTATFLVLAMALSAVLVLPKDSTQAASISSVRSGDWSDPSTWSIGRVPKSNDDITVSAGTLVVYDVVSDEVLGKVNVEGTLTFSRAVDTRLKLKDNLLVMAGGFLDMGTAEAPIPPDVQAKLIFVLAKGKTFLGGSSPEHMMFVEGDTGLWAMSGGRWEVHGAPLLRTWSKLVADAPAGASFVIVEHNVSDWYIGGNVLITQTTNPLKTMPEIAMWENEVRKIAALEKLPEGKTKLTLNEPLAYFHHGSPDPNAMRGEAGLLTRNILITTDIDGVDEKTLEPKITDRFTGKGSGRHFAHTIYLPGAKGNVQYAELKYMGHAEALARYPIHFHLMGETSRGMAIRGNSVWYSGHRAYVAHETIGMLIEDNVAFNTVNSPYLVEITPPPPGSPLSQPGGIVAAPQDNVLFHNLGVEAMQGSPRTDAAIFWFDQYLYQTVMGNVAVASNLNAFNSRIAGFQLDEVSNLVVPGKPLSMLFRKNEAHSNSRDGLLTWQGHSISQDFVDFFLWRNGLTGYNWNSYVPTYRIFQSKFYENGLTGITTQGIRVHVQDSEFLSGGSDWTQVWKGLEGKEKREKVGFFISHYTAVPSPVWSSHIIRTTFKNTGAPNYLADISRIHQPCPDPEAELEIGEKKSACPGDFIDLMGNTYTEKGIDAGWHENANSYFRVVDYKGPDATYPKHFYLNRKDQTAGALNQTGLSKSIINDKTFYYGQPDALVTPITTGLPTPSLPNYPPQTSLSVSVSGSLATMTATVSDDTNPSPKVEFFVDENLVATKTAAPYETTVDISKSGRKYAYLYARAFDGEIDKAAEAPTEGGFDGSPDINHPWKLQRAYSKVIELGPEVLLGGKPSPSTNQAPYVDAGSDQTITLPALASLDGTVFDDGLPQPPGTLTTAWTKVIGPGTASFASASSIDPTVSFSKGGTYVLRLTANDGTLSAFDDVTITVNGTNQTPSPTPPATPGIGPNQAPYVDAGSSQTITLPALASLDGTVSDDGLPKPPGTLATYWTKTSGPGTASFASTSSVDTKATFSKSGTYVLRLTASDGKLSAFDEVAITVNIPRGDANRDGQFKAEDIHLVVDWVLGRVAMPGTDTPGFVAADVDGDASIDPVDVTLMIDRLLGRIDKFPIEP